MRRQYWKYIRLYIGHKNIQHETIDETLRPMTAQEFLSALAHWNHCDDWKYYPVLDQMGILSKHMCANIKEQP